jgi:tRNA(Ile)-lysidine synthase
MDKSLLESAFAIAWPLNRWQDLTLLIGVSGGADSVALLRLIVDARSPDSTAARTVAVHVNHGLRGDASTEDQRFVESLCKSLGIECIVGHVAPQAIAAADGDGLEAACRAARYDFFRHTAERLGARYLAVAHTADDQAETILHHILRGTGLAGLAGMSKFRALSEAVTLARPLLDVRRTEIIAYLESLGQTWREDATNRESTFTRNRLRNDLLPQLARDYNPDVVPALLRLGQQADEAHEAIDRMAQGLAEFCAKRGTQRDGNGVASVTVEIDCTRVFNASQHVVRQMFVGIWQQLDWPRQAMGFHEWDALAALALEEELESATRVFPGEVIATRQESTLQLKRRRE